MSHSRKAIEEVFGQASFAQNYMGGSMAPSAPAPGPEGDQDLSPYLLGATKPKGRRPIPDDEEVMSTIVHILNQLD